MRFLSGSTPELWKRVNKCDQLVCPFCSKEDENIVIHIIEKCSRFTNLKKKYKINGKTAEMALYPDNDNMYNFMKFLDKIYIDVKWDYMND